MDLVIVHHHKVARALKNRASRSLALGNYDSSSRESGHTNAFLSSRISDQRIFNLSMHINLPITCTLPQSVHHHEERPMCPIESTSPRTSC